MSRLRELSLFVAYGAGFSGVYLFVLGLMALGHGREIRTFLIFYWACFFGFSVIFVARSIYRRSLISLGWLGIPLLTFWLLYFLRIALDGYLSPVSLGQPPIEYVQKAIAMIFIPMLIFLERRVPHENRSAFRGFFIVHLLCMIFALIYYRDSLDKAYRILRKTVSENETFISPITLSYLGVVAVVIGVQQLLREMPTKRKPIQKIILFAIIILGAVFIFFGGTRAALLVCIIVCLLLGMISMKRSEIKKIIKKSMALVGIAIILGFILGRMEPIMMNRFTVLIDQINSASQSVGGARLTIYRDALEQFAQSPLIGSGLEEKNRLFYPHNHIIEAFMATGILGGLSFAILSLAALVFCFKILKYRQDYGWIACLFIVYFLRGLFSGSIIQPILWYSMMGVFANSPRSISGQAINNSKTDL